MASSAGGEQESSCRSTVVRPSGEKEATVRGDYLPLNTKEKALVGSVLAVGAVCACICVSVCLSLVAGTARRT